MLAGILLYTSSVKEIKNEKISRLFLRFSMDICFPVYGIVEVDKKQITGI